jgi:hypothetical protein
VFDLGRYNENHCQYWLILVPGYDSTELAEVWMFLDFAIRAFLNIPAKDGISAALQQASSIPDKSGFPLRSNKHLSEA